MRERDLLRLVMAGGTRARYAAIRDRVSEVLAQKHLRMQLHDANTAFYANPGYVWLWYAHSKYDRDVATTIAIQIKRCFVEWANTSMTKNTHRTHHTFLLQEPLIFL